MYLADYCVSVSDVASRRPTCTAVVNRLTVQRVRRSMFGLVSLLLPVRQSGIHCPSFCVDTAVGITSFDAT